jgi:CheY-like chemotaxis protein
MDKPKVLVVDDQAIVRQGAAITLQGHGFDVDQAASGAEALNMVKACSYAVIIMDYNMPNMDGFECTAQIRELEKGSGNRVPVICVSANMREDMRAACLGADMDDYIDKDWKREELHDLVLKWLKD